MSGKELWDNQVASLNNTQATTSDRGVITSLEAKSLPETYTVFNDCQESVSVVMTSDRNPRVYTQGFNILGLDNANYTKSQYLSFVFSVYLIYAL